jgi:curved DNA-binding protein CbpA
MSQPAPTASGTLAATPFGHLLIYALDRRLTGTMVFEEPEHRKHAIYFLLGAPAAARGAVVVAPLGELAVERGELSAERLEPALEAAREGGKRLGELLLDWAVLDAEALDALLREQVARRVEMLHELPPGTAYGYYEGINFLERAGGPSQPCAPLPLILRVMRVAPETGKGADLLARFGGAMLRFHAEAPLAHCRFEPAEQAVVDVLRAKPQPLAELKARDLMPEPELERLLGTLLLLRHFDTGSGAPPIGTERRTMTPAAPLPATAAPPPDAVAVAPRGSAAPIGASAAPAGGVAPASDDPFRREAAARTLAEKQTYYDLLGVAPDAPVHAIAAAYFQLAKRWHPDRLAPEHADLRDVAMRIFARMGEAHQVLSDADRRREYDATLATSDISTEEQEQVQRLLRAATNFQKAQVLLRRNNLPAAEEAARLALADAPEEADHIALVAWLATTKQNPDLPHALAELDRAARLEPANLRVRWFRGQLLKRVGKERQAQEDFRLIVEKDPRHVDAQRELRLFEMQRSQRKPGSDPPRGRLTDPGPQRRSSPAPNEKGSFLGKLFKK